MSRWSTAGLLSAAIALVLMLPGTGASAAFPDRVLGWRVALGKGEVASFADLQDTGVPRAIGVLISNEALAGPPSGPSDLHHCFDRDGDGLVARPAECADTHEFVIPLPDAVSRRGDVPFKWVLFNWNPNGHIPPGVYDVPHFDIHFEMVPIADIFAIRDGPCGPEFVNCEDLATAKLPLPGGMTPPEFSDVDAVVPAMGNHLIDLSGLEFNGQPFTHSWIYGVYGGRVIFYEQMVTLNFLLSQPNVCTPIKSPQAVAVSGFYPTQQCIRVDAGSAAVAVTMEEFVYRQAI